MVAIPAALAVTSPLPLTMATAVLEDLQIKATGVGMGSLFSSTAVTFSACIDPGASNRVDGDKVNACSFGGLIDLRISTRVSTVFGAFRSVIGVPFFLIRSIICQTLSNG